MVYNNNNYDFSPSNANVKDESPAWLNSFFENGFKPSPKIDVSEAFTTSKSDHFCSKCGRKLNENEVARCSKCLDS